MEIVEMARLKRSGWNRHQLAAQYGISPKSVDKLLREKAEASQAIAERVMECEHSIDRLAAGDVELARLAALYEGEGLFEASRLGLHMIDRDVIEHAAWLVGINFQQRRPGNPRWNPTWMATMSGYVARAFADRIYPLMGQRRQAQIQVMRQCGSSIDPQIARVARGIEIAGRIAMGEKGPALAVEYGMTHQNVYYLAKRYKDMAESPSG